MKFVLHLAMLLSDFVNSLFDPRFLRFVWDTRNYFLPNSLECIYGSFKVLVVVFDFLENINREQLRKERKIARKGMKCREKTQREDKKTEDRVRSGHTSNQVMSGDRCIKSDQL